MKRTIDYDIIANVSDAWYHMQSTLMQVFGTKTLSSQKFSDIFVVADVFARGLIPAANKGPREIKESDNDEQNDDDDVGADCGKEDETRNRRRRRRRQSRLIIS